MRWTLWVCPGSVILALIWRHLFSLLNPIHHIISWVLFFFYQNLKKTFFICKAWIFDLVELHVLKGLKLRFCFLVSLMEIKAQASRSLAMQLSISHLYLEVLLLANTSSFSLHVFVLSACRFLPIGNQIVQMCLINYCHHVARVTFINVFHTVFWKEVV